MKKKKKDIKKKKRLRAKRRRSQSVAAHRCEAAVSVWTLVVVVEGGVRWEYAPKRELSGSTHRFRGVLLGDYLSQHTRLLCFTYSLVFGSPSQCMEFHCGDNKMKKKNLKKTNVELVICQFSISCFLPAFAV